jgi:hypothetical protein
MAHPRPAATATIYRTRRPWLAARLPALARLLLAILVALVLLPLGFELAPDDDRPGLGARRALAQTAPVGAGFVLNAGDLRFILTQVKIAENHAANPPYLCSTLLGPGPNQVAEHRLPFGLRTVNGSCNHLLAGQELFGAADQEFVEVTTPVFGPAEAGTHYNQAADTVVDARPRLISNLIVDQTSANPAAIAVAGPECALLPPGQTCFFPNVAPDEGLSAPFNTMFTFFGQFFDHGLDLVNKGGNGSVFIPLQPDDPLFVPGSPTNFMVVTRASVSPGPDGLRGTADDVRGPVNQTTPFVDQNQTYTSHPSHQVFLREYELGADGQPHATGRMIDGAGGNIGNWSEVKAQALTFLGIALSDEDVLNGPLLATDPYGRFLPGPNGFPQLATTTGLVEGSIDTPVSPAAVNALRTGHAFLDDIAHHAAPGQGRVPDTDPGFTDDGNPNTYDDELLGRHFLTGDGRGNENIALTAVHTVFHSEHNRLRGYIDSLVHSGILAPAEVADWERVAQEPGSPADPAGPNSGWDYGERLFQAAKFVTEMQYQHLVFEEFARKLAPAINPFVGDGINFTTDVNPAIAGEFAHAVYRLGHSMLTELVHRTDPVTGATSDISLFAAFLNPNEFNNGGTLSAAEAAGRIWQGGTAQVGNEIDEFVTNVLRNQLVGLPLDLATVNIARGRSEGLPPLNGVRRQLFDATGNPDLAPFTSWADFSLNLKHPESLLNFVAAYGTHPLIAGAASVADKRFEADRIVNGTILPGPDGVVGDDPTTFIDESLDDTPATPAEPFVDANGNGAWDAAVPAEPFVDANGNGTFDPGEAFTDTDGDGAWDDAIAAEAFTDTNGNGTRDAAAPAGPGPDGVLGDDPATFIDESADDVPPPADRFDFLLSEGAWTSVGGVTTTGLDSVDLWMGGLAEKIAPFGGMLGSTFNFIFEIQLESLQNADRFYYLERLDGLNLLAQLEGNSLAELVMRNTTAVALPADVFSRADFAFTLANLGTSGPILDDPATEYSEPSLLTRNIPTAGTIRFNGGEHVLWNGSAGPDRVFSSIGDDTIRLNDGNDWAEGGAGNDQHIGGDGDDILVDTFGDDVIKGGPGNDAINGGSGPFDLLQGNEGNDFIVGGIDSSEIFGGPGNDVFYVGKGLSESIGGAGDDWAEGSETPASILIGDDNNQFQDDPFGGHDVLIAGLGDTDFDSEGGDDIMVATVSPTHRNEGMLGFDWVTYRGDPLPVDADMLVTGILLVSPAPNELRDRFDQVEGLSGWNQDDLLRGDDRTEADLASGGLTGVPDGDVLTSAGITRIAGLAAILPAGATEFRGGNIILGGGGSDLLEGRGGDDILDGDAWLNVQLQAPDPASPGNTKLVNSLQALRNDVFAARINPGDITIVRSISTTGASASDVDIAVFSGPLAEYDITFDGAGVITVAHVLGTLTDGTDILRNVERLRFADTCVNADVDLTACAPNATGTVTISSLVPAEDGALTATLAITDPDSFDPAAVTVSWQAQTGPSTWTTVATGLSFTPGDAEVGLPLRVVAAFVDSTGSPESIIGQVTAPVANVNDPPTGGPVLSTSAPEVGLTMSVDLSTIADADGLDGVTLDVQWLAGGAAITGATGLQFTPTATEAGLVLSVRVTFTDEHGTAEVLTSGATAPVLSGGPPPAPAVGSHQLSSVALGSEVAIFGRNDSSELWFRETSGGVFGGWSRIATGVASRPEAVSAGTSLYVFYRGTGNDIGFVVRTGLGAWSAPQSLGGTAAGSPAVAVDSNGDLVVVVLNAAGDIFYSRRSGGVFSSWAQMDGQLAGRLALINFQGDVYLLGLNVAGNSWARTWSAASSTWGAWTALGGVLTDGPAAAVHNGTLFMFGLNGQGVSWYRALSGGTWGAWTSLAGVLGDAPAAVATDTTLLFLGVNLAGATWEREFTGAWGGWNPLTGILAAGPEAVAAGSQAYFFGINDAGNLWYRRWNGASWDAWTTLGGVLAIE